MKRRFTLLCIIVIIFVLSATSCNIATSPITYDCFAMDTVCSVTAYDGMISEDAISEMADIFSDEATSQITAQTGKNRIFANKAGDTVLFDDCVSAVLTAAELVREYTDGAFDLRIAPLTELWNIPSAEEPPSADDVSAALSLINNSEIFADKSSVSFSSEGEGIDVGAICKGYLASVMFDGFKKAGYNGLLINLGGNITLVGDKNGEPFIIGIKKPYGNSAFCSLKVSDCSVVTSGGYERYFEYNGIKYHHILDPRTGYPADSCLQSVTVVCKNHAMADILSTACFVVGLEDSIDLLNHFRDDYGILGCVFLSENNTVTVYGDISESFELLSGGYTVEYR